MLHRQITECWVWDDDEPYTKGQAWIYLLLCANHSDAKIYLDGKLEIVKRGQYVTSIRKLAEKFSWSRDKVSKFLKLLEQDNMIIQNSDTKKTLLTIVNYGKYQSIPSEKQTPNGHETDTERTADGQQTDSTNATELPPPMPPTDTNNNDNNINNDNNENNIPPISPQREWDYLRHTNLENTKHILNTGLYTDAELLKDYPRLWECIKTWMKYKDEKTPRKDNHYAGDTSIVTLLNKFVKHCQSSGEDAVIEIVETSISSNYRGILWDKLQEPRTNNTTRSQQIDEQMKDW